MQDTCREGCKFGCPPQHQTSIHASSNLGIDLWPAKALWPRSKAPEQTKASPMPGDNGFWFDNDQDIAPCRPKPAEQNPKHPIRPPKFRPPELSIQNGKLLAKQVFQREVRTQPEGAWDQREQPQNRQNHDRRVSGLDRGMSIVSMRPGF